MSLDTAFDLAEQVTPRLLPLLPYLVEGMKKLRETIRNKIKTTSGQEALETAEKIWKKLEPIIEKLPEGTEILEKAAQQPNDPKVQEELRKTIEAALQGEALRKSVSNLLEKNKKNRVNIRSYIKAGNVYSSIRAVKVRKLKDLQGGNITSEIIVGDVRGPITGIEETGNTTFPQLSLPTHRRRPRKKNLQKRSGGTRVQ